MRESSRQTLDAYGTLLGEGTRLLRWRIMKEAMEAASWPEVPCRDAMAVSGIDSDAARRRVLADISQATIEP